MDIRKSDRSFQQWCDCDLYDRGSCFGYEIVCGSKYENNFYIEGTTNGIKKINEEHLLFTS